MAPRVDEDGRCVLTGLLPDQCACNDHRNSPQLVDVDPRGLVIQSKTVARYNGRCALGGHLIIEGDEIGLAAQSGVDEAVGWICQPCVGLAESG